MSEKAKEFLEAISFASSKLTEWMYEMEESGMDEVPDENDNYKSDYIVDWIESIRDIYDRAFDKSKEWNELKEGDKE